jgi:hypothetical protein
VSRVANRHGPAPALFLVPVIALEVAPVAAAGPGQHWVSLCTSDGGRLVSVADGEGIPDQGPGDRGHGMCAHATCPREDRPGDTGRARL